MSRVLWQARQEVKDNSQIVDYTRWLESKLGLTFSNYSELWEWSIAYEDEFWKSIYDYFEIIDHGKYSSVRSEQEMPDTTWFEGSRLNYAEHIFRNKNDQHPALIHYNEGGEYGELDWADLEKKVGSFQSWLKNHGVTNGDAVVAYMPNVAETIIAFLAVNSIGAIWSSCSPDFGLDSLIDRFDQINPKVLISCDGYFYSGKSFDRLETVTELQKRLGSLKEVVVLPVVNNSATIAESLDVHIWEDCLKEEASIKFEPVPFDHPIWVLFSSGTTGKPKAITHCHGGVLLEHMKYLAFHNDLHAGERFFWYTTTGWMMWNFLQASMLLGGVPVLYEGSPAKPDLNTLWSFTEKAQINHFGTSAPFLIACMKKGLKPKDEFDLSKLRSIGSTGSPLTSDAYQWCYDNVKSDLWLCSMSGGTDVCTAFVGGCILEPVREGDIQVRALGCSLFAYDDEGKEIVGEVGEMVITKPMPSMPIYFWNDPAKKRYLSSYFDYFPSVWRHGDWVKINPSGSLAIYGRSDATLNRQGIRIGTAEIYKALNLIESVEDALIVNIEKSNGSHYMPLFVKLKDGLHLDEALENEIKSQLRSTYSPRHVPDEIIEVKDIPYTISGKKLESPIKRLLMGMSMEKVVNVDALRNPESLEFFIDFSNQISSE